jgi:hypothetical protein
VGIILEADSHPMATALKDTDRTHNSSSTKSKQSVVRLSFQLFAYDDATGELAGAAIARQLAALGLPTQRISRKALRT